jgi:hypothetical protein
MQSVPMIILGGTPPSPSCFASLSLLLRLPLPPSPPPAPSPSYLISPLSLLITSPHSPPHYISLLSLLITFPHSPSHYISSPSPPHYISSLSLQVRLQYWLVLLRLHGVYSRCVGGRCNRERYCRDVHEPQGQGHRTGVRDMRRLQSHGQY